MEYFGWGRELIRNQEDNRNKEEYWFMWLDDLRFKVGGKEKSLDV